MPKKNRYTKSEIIGEGVEIIMPKVFGDAHGALFQRYFEKDKGTAMNVERTVYAMNKDGYVIPCTLLIKVVPSLTDGIQTIGFLKEKETELDEDHHKEDCYVLYGQQNGIIYGVRFLSKDT